LSAWLAFGLGVALLPSLWLVAVAALLLYEALKKAIHARRKKPASEVVHGLCRAIGEQDRRISQRYIARWRLPGKRGYQLMLFKEGPKEPTKRFFWPREPEPLDDPQEGQ
jgi:hypothetical protein